MAISVAVAVGDAADRLVPDLPRRSGDSRSEPGPRKASRWAAGHARAPQRVRGYVDLGVEEGARLVVDGRGFMSPVTRTATSWGRVSSTVSSRRCAYIRRRFSDRCSASCGCPTWQPRSLWSTNMSTAMARRSSRERRSRAPLCAGSAGRHGGRQRAIPVPMAFHSFGGWKRSLFGPLHVHGPDGVRFYTRLKTVTSRWPAATREGAHFVMPTMK